MRATDPSPNHRRGHQENCNSLIEIDCALSNFVKSNALNIFVMAILFLLRHIDDLVPCGRLLLVCCTRQLIEALKTTINNVNNS